MELSKKQLKIQINDTDKDFAFGGKRLKGIFTYPK